CPQILYIRPNMSIYFGNAEYVYEYVLQKVEERKKALKFLLLDMEAVNYIDASGSLMLIRLLDRLRSMGVEPALANVGCTLYPLLENVHIDRHMQVDLFFDSKGRSIVELFKRLDQEYCRKRCPYAVFRECWSVKEENFKPLEKAV
ncbi:MAG: sodium-independent anion transporter, partial [Aquificaceae bacterium]|nr:sodium-independent anion transporter [Aquificaceae bacterium]